MIIPMTFRYKGDDVYDKVTLAMAEVLKSGTTCFLDPMVTDIASFVSKIKAVDEMGTRACLVYNLENASI